MNMRPRIHLIALIAFALVLSSAVPALAFRTENDECGLYWPVTYPPEGIEYLTKVPGGVYEWDLEGGIITITCTGVIPLGEPFRSSSKAYYDNLDQAREYYCREYGDVDCVVGDPFVLDPSVIDFLTTTGYKGEELPAFDWNLLVEDDGEYFLWRAFYVK